MKEYIGHHIEDITTLSKNEIILDDTKKNLVDRVFSNEREAADGAIMESLLKYVENMQIYPKDGVLYYKTIVNILMELMFNNLKHNVFLKDQPTNLTIQQNWNHFIIKISIVGSKAKQMKLSNSIALSELSQEDIKKSHTKTLFNNKDVDENWCGGMWHKVTVRRIKRLFPDAKDIFHISEPIEIGEDLVKSELTIRVPVLNQKHEKTLEYA